MKATVAIARCPDYAPGEVETAVRNCIELIGGIRRFVTPRARVLVKPNLLMAIEPERGVTTHPQVVRAVVRILKELDAQIILGDAPSVWAGEAENIEEVFDKTGMRAIAEEFGVRLVNFDNPCWYNNFPLTKYLKEVDCFISLPKFKTHNLTILTGAIKNLFGLVCGTYKTELHKKYVQAESFSGMLVDIYERAAPVFSVVDGVTAMEAEGPGSSGKLKKVGLILASTDAPALDSVLARIMGVAPERIFTNKIAALRNLGVGDLDSIEILGERLDAIRQDPFILPCGSLKDKIPLPVLNIAKNLLKFYPKINTKACNLCGACVKVCPNAAMTVKFEAIDIDYAKCISCFCCQEACPHAAISKRKSLLARLLRL